MQSFEGKCSAVAQLRERRTRRAKRWSARFHWTETFKTWISVYFQKRARSFSGAYLLCAAGGEILYKPSGARLVGGPQHF